MGINKPVESQQEEINRLKAEIVALQQAKSNGTLTFKCKSVAGGGKGALSLYGMGRYPVTLYKSQWKRLAKAINDGELDKAFAKFATTLTEKPAAE